MRKTVHRILLAGLYLCGLSLVAYFAWRYSDYYMLPLTERPHSEFHTILKPGGKLGHGFGIAGSGMILLLFLYTLRKRRVVRWGTLSHWLNVHIMFGIIGPLFVTLHTAFKYNGIVTVSYFSMIAVMASGIFGRYLYIQIPRAITGGELNPRDLRNREEELEHQLKEEAGLNGREIEELKMTLQGPLRERGSAISVLFSLLLDDVVRPFRRMSLKRVVRDRHPELTAAGREEIARLVRELVLLSRKIRFLDTIQRIFYYWHVIHRPFAYVMILIMLIHVSVVIYLGYRWIF